MRIFRSSTIMWAVVAVLAAVLSGCSDDDPKRPAPEPVPAGQLVEASECKSTGSAEDPLPLPNDQGFLFWSYDADRALLRIRHVNAGLNCCPVYTANITVMGNRLRIRESETEGLCRCLCLYDFAFEVTDLPIAVYEVTVDEEYLLPDDPPLAGTIDLTKAEFGTIRAARDHYPWGTAE